MVSRPQQISLLRYHRPENKVSVEIGTIVSDNGFRNPESTNDVISNEVIHNLLCDRFVRSDFYPLGEVVNCDKDEPMTIVCGQLNGTNDIHTLSCEGQRGAGVMKLTRRNLKHASLSLALVAFLHVEDAITFHGQPKVTRFQYIFCQHKTMTTPPATAGVEWLLLLLRQ
ncbi:hypothetical protein CQW23_23886 [Capsicum baccatum]|uniref:Uncharacterized protein n=1 Tax=Capsicum baccatum TaxID=33114 RepID=A0A2G2VT96_CAPBA|nr:hypothetical protein CQW23_23886 [Capsicum baccatum]